VGLVLIGWSPSQHCGGLYPSEGLAFADHLLTRERNQKPASLRSGILRCIKKPSPERTWFFYFAQPAAWLLIIKWSRRDFSLPQAQHIAAQENSSNPPRVLIPPENYCIKKPNKSVFLNCGGAGGIRTLVQTWDMLRFLHA
jgi:hypothetical protein